MKFNVNQSLRQHDNEEVHYMRIEEIFSKKNEESEAEALIEDEEENEQHGTEEELLKFMLEVAENEETQNKKKLEENVEKKSSDGLVLKELPEHLKYVFFGKERSQPVIITTDLKLEEEKEVVQTLKQYKEAIAWTGGDLKGINHSICMHKILMEENAKTFIEHHRRLNLKMKEVVRKEVLKWLNVGFIYAISDSPWVSPIHVVPKKGGITVIRNEKNELIPTRTVTGWRVCIDYRKLNTTTRKDHYPLPALLIKCWRLVGHSHYCFLDGYFGYN